MVADRQACRHRLHKLSATRPTPGATVPSIAARQTPSRLVRQRQAARAAANGAVSDSANAASCAARCAHTANESPLRADETKMPNAADQTASHKAGCAVDRLPDPAPRHLSPSWSRSTCGWGAPNRASFAQAPPPTSNGSFHSAANRRAAHRSPGSSRPGANRPLPEISSNP